ncbi:MAG: radical SAM protein, partial [Planctomycetes bacterium]|nr:radical SAM protein [Planctomycetota bacterium]
MPTYIEADIIGMTVITGTATRCYQLAKRYRDQGITVILGGPHVSLIPDEAQEHADSIVVGYAEEEWPRLLHDYVNNKLQRRYTQSPDLSLENSPIPKRDVLPRSKFLTEAVFEATRSCIHKCEFCVVPTAWGNTLLQKPIEHIIQDIKQLKAKRAIFIDLNIISNKPYARALFEALIPLKIKWFGLSTTLLCKDLELLDLCARSGCRGLLMGLESISSDSLSSMHKGFNNPDDFANVVDSLHKHNISLQGCFVFGNDTDTPDIFMETAKFAVDIGIDLPRFAIST